MRKVILYFDPAAQAILVKKTAENGEVKVVLSSKHNFVSENEIVARIVDLKPGEEIDSHIDEGYNYHNVRDYFNFSVGSGVYFDESSKSYKASYYGFVVLKESKLMLLSPLVLSKDKVRAYYNVMPTRFGNLPSYNEIVEILHAEKVVSVITGDKYAKQIAAIDLSNPHLQRILVAEGRDPVNGFDEYFEPLLSFEKQAGRILSDGRMDYKEVGSIIQVQKNQEILQAIAGVKSEDGYDIFGEKVPAVKVEKEGMKKGENLLQSGFDPSIYVSGIDGCISVVNGKVDVLPVAVINGDVGLDSGNINFNGTVHVTGSVLPGFKVQADSDIIVDKDVEDAQLTSGGDITVKLGVVGKESVKLVAKGNISARFMQNVKAEAGKSVTVDDSIINCDIVSYEKVSVTGKNGKIIGGKISALYEINAHTFGTQAETMTSLTVGRNFILENEISKKRTEIIMIKERVEEINTSMKMQFGEEIFKNPKEYIKILPPMKKKTCLLLLNDLSSANNNLKKLIEEAKLIEEKMKLEKEPVIIATNKVYPGVVVNVRKSVKKIDRLIENVKFYEDQLDKSVRFVAAT
jgi:uncharacterized protein (DUF342 family)